MPGVPRHAQRDGSTAPRGGSLANTRCSGKERRWNLLSVAGAPLAAGRCNVTERDERDEHEEKKGWQIDSRARSR